MFIGAGILERTMIPCNEVLKYLAEAIPLVVALYTVFKGVCEYNDYRRRERIKYLLSFGEKYTSNDEIKDVLLFLEKLEDDNMYKNDCIEEDGSYKDSALPVHYIEMFMRFIEELELLIRGNAISESAALNLFGYYTTILDKYNMRWPKLGYKEKYWNVYRDFVEKAKKFDYKNVTV